MTPPDVVHRGRWRGAVLLVLAAFAATFSPASSGRAGSHSVIDATAEAASCAVPPVSFAELERLRALPAFDANRATPGILPEGNPVDAADDLALRELVDTFLACSCAGEPLRVYALYSEPYLARLLSRERGFDRRLYQALATPRPSPPDECPMLRSISGVRQVAERRAVAVVTVAYPNIEKVKEFVFWFAQTNREWSIDEIEGEISFALP